MALPQFSRLSFALAALMTGSALSAGAQDLVDSPPPRDLGPHIYESACASCHYRGAGKSPFGSRGPLADGSSDELTQYILFGKAPEDDEGGMPAFGPVLTDADVTRLVIWLRSTSKPDDPWTDVPASVTRMRANGERED